MALADKKHSPRRDLDAERIIEYRVFQITTAHTSDHIQRVIERFERELELQFGASVAVEVRGVSPEPTQ